MQSSKEHPQVTRKAAQSGADVTLSEYVKVGTVKHVIEWCQNNENMYRSRTNSRNGRGLTNQTSLGELKHSEFGDSVKNKWLGEQES